MLLSFQIASIFNNFTNHFWIDSMLYSMDFLLKNRTCPPVQFSLFLPDDWSSIYTLVDIMNCDTRFFTPASKASRMPCKPGKAGKRDGWILMILYHNFQQYRSNDSHIQLIRSNRSFLSIYAKLLLHTLLNQIL